jgi:small subunit ribosomal protein S6
MEERLYDLIFICRPATPEEEVAKITTTLEHACAEKGAKVEKTEKWGTKKMAYRVAKHREGSYVYLQIRSSHGELIHELERRLKVSDPVIKYLTIRLDEDLKRQQKFARKRERKAAKRPRKQAPGGGSGPSASPAAPAAPSVAGGGEAAPAAS